MSNLDSRAEMIRREIELEVKKNNIENRISKLKTEVRKHIGLISVEQNKIDNANRKRDKVNADEVINTHSAKIDNICKDIAKLEESLRLIKNTEFSLKKIGEMTKVLKEKADKVTDDQCCGDNCCKSNSREGNETTEGDI